MQAPEVDHILKRLDSRSQSGFMFKVESTPCLEGC